VCACLSCTCTLHAAVHACVTILISERSMEESYASEKDPPQNMVGAAGTLVNASHPARERRLAVLDFSANGYAVEEGSSAGIARAKSRGPTPGRPLIFDGRQGKLYADGELFNVKGINWYGSEGRTGAPSGMHKHPIDFYMKFLAEHKFNAIRLLVSAHSLSCVTLPHKAAATSGGSLQDPTHVSMAVRMAQVSPKYVQLSHAVFVTRASLERCCVLRLCSSTTSQC
jgi:hypothetical protein